MMSSRVKRMRQELYQRLRAKGTPGSWEHIVTQIGMFCFTGLSCKSVLHSVLHLGYVLQLSKWSC